MNTWNKIKVIVKWLFTIYLQLLFIGTPAFEKLTEVLTKKSLLKDIKQMSCTWGLSFGAKPLCYQTFSFLIPWNDKQVMADKICIIMANEHRIPDANFKVSQTAVCLFLTSKIIFILIYIPPGCRLLSCTSMRTVTENMQNYKMVLSRLTLSSQSTRKESIQSRRF